VVAPLGLAAALQQSFQRSLAPANPKHDDAAYPPAAATPRPAPRLFKQDTRVAQLFVGNLEAACTADELRAAFEGVAAVLAVKVPVDRATGRGKGIGFVTVAAADAERVRRTMDGLHLGQKRLAVKASKHDPATRSKTMALNQRLVAAGSAADVLALYEREGSKFNEVNLATALYRLGHHQRSPSADLAKDRRYGQLVAATARSISNNADKWESRGLANVCWGVAHLRRVRAREKALLDCVADAAVPRVSESTPQTLANTAWAFATAGVRHAQLFDAIAAAAPQRMGDFKPQELSNLVWAFAKHGDNARLQFPSTSGDVAGPLDAQLFRAVARRTRRLVWVQAARGGEHCLGLCQIFRRSFGEALRRRRVQDGCQRDGRARRFRDGGSAARPRRFAFGSCCGEDGSV